MGRLERLGKRDGPGSRGSFVCPGKGQGRRIRDVEVQIEFMIGLRKTREITLRQTIRNRNKEITFW